MQQTGFNKGRFLLINFAMLLSLGVSAQYEEKDFIRYTVKDGLNDNYITCLQQDKQGYIWTGSDLGLNRFDGNTFKNLTHPSSGSRLITGPVKNILVTGENQLGIVSRNGFQLVNISGFSVQHYFIPDSTAFKVQLNDVWEAVQLPGSGVGISTAAGFYVFDKNGRLNFRHDAYFLKDIGRQRIQYGRDIFTINKNEYLVYIEAKGLAYFNYDKKLYREIQSPDPEWNAFRHPEAANENWVTKSQLSKDEFIFVYNRRDSIVYYNHALKKTVVSPLPFHSFPNLSWESKIVMVNDSSFLINDGTRGFYLFSVNRQSGRISGDGKRFFPNSKIICLYVDKDKRLWIGTSKGLLQQKLSTSFINAYRYTSLPADSITGGFSAVYSCKNKLYAGRYSLHKGLVIINELTMEPEEQVDFFGGNNNFNEVFSIQMYHPDTLWLGTNGGLIWFDTKTKKYGRLLDEKKYPWAKNFAGILAPPRKDGYAWMCSYLGGLVVRYSIQTHEFTVFSAQSDPALPFEKVKSIAYDSWGDVWIGGHSLARFNNRKQMFDTLITVYGGVNKFNDDILAMSADNNGSLWLHNAYNGLLEYKIKDKAFVAYSVKEGIPSDVLQTFSPVVDNMLWIGSNTNLFKFDVVTKKSTVYNQEDGLPDNKPSGRSIYFDPGRRSFYMSADEYIVKFPADHSAYSHYSSDLIIQELVINDKYFFQPGNLVHLSYNENNFLINYTVIDFEKNNYQFAYKLNNADNWISLGGQRSLNLNNLQPGKYLIQLKATGKSGDEKLAAFTVFIAPPFWKTWWFVVACAVVLAGILYLAYQRRIKQVKQKANIDKLLAQTEMKALHAQMNPHFIFNSLNSIREMILNNENNEASRYLSKFAHLIRITLDQSGSAFVSLRNTIDYLQRYIEMEQIRNDNFTCRIQADDELDQDEIMLPPMLIQPFAENAIWHASPGKNTRTLINIEFKKMNRQLICIIDDNGTGIERSLQKRMADPNLHKPVGISNIRQRIQLLNEKYQLQSSVTIEDKSLLSNSTESGTRVTIHLPIEINTHE